jgi:hypothetical protein
MTGYLPLGFEFAAEITFPIAEVKFLILCRGLAGMII